MSSSVTLAYIIKAKFRRKWTTLDLLLNHWQMYAHLVIFITFIALPSLIQPVEGSFLPANTLACNGTPCLHGDCVDNHRCVCHRGWQGAACDACGGRLNLTAPFGYITDGVGNYSSELQCTWLIDAHAYRNATIRLQLNHFETECSWDHLYIFDGDSIYAPMIAALSGSLFVNSQQQQQQQQQYSSSLSSPSSSPSQRHLLLPEISASSERVYLYFYSDAAYNMTGFNISYSINACPRNCSGNGVCIGDRCTCSGLYMGEACERPVCPNACSGHGTCDAENHRCICNFGHIGLDCSQQRSSGYWTAIETTNTPAGGRALHQAILHQSSMYIIGGEHFDRRQSFLIRCDLASKKWYDFKLNEGDIEPESRFGHSAILFNERIYVFGGLVRNGSIVADIWQFDLRTERWKEIRDTNTMSILLNGERLASMGHTATLVGTTMVVIFGYSPIYGYLNHVQHYDIDRQVWKLVKTTGALVKGGFGHSASYDHLSRLIYVFGGSHSISISDTSLVDFLYGYNKRTESWIIFTPSKSPRYLHSASIINGMLLVYGGSGHNVTDDNSADTCFSPSFLAYDIACDRWRSLPMPKISNEFEAHHIGKYGHSAIVFEEAIYTFGGFNGLMTPSLLKYVPANCTELANETECISSRLGSKCAWNAGKSMCQFYNQIKSSLIQLSDGGGHHQRSEAHCVVPGESGTAIVSTDYTYLCARQTACSNCVQNSYDCVWCRDHCVHRKCDKPSFWKSSPKENNGAGLSGGNSMLPPKAINDYNMCDAREMQIYNCDKMHNCHSCHFEHYCTWERDRKCTSLMNSMVDRLLGSTIGPVGGNSAAISFANAEEEKTGCEVPCYLRTSCENCTQGSCMWCSSLQRCIDSNAYSAIYSIGQCMEWTTQPHSCSMLSCTEIKSCNLCLKSPQCGWCDDGSGTGVGMCLPGSATTAYAVPNGNEKVPEPNICPSARWHFTECPICECNGHSYCLNGTNTCRQPCGDDTEGVHCQYCRQGFYGRPANGGICEACSCNGHSDHCNRETGKCSCTTKGLTGHHCDKCDEQNNYVGHPQFVGDNSCFYNLSTSYSYTFNMSKPDDKYYTRINFMNTPILPDIDVEFTVNCQDQGALVNISYGDAFNSSSLVINKRAHEKLECGNIKLKFAHDDSQFEGGNTTFFVTVYNFKTPIIIQISFSQHRNLDLLQFFLTFSSCFLALLIVAAILWKVKQRYDLVRRRQQMFVEMEQMASRPFSGVLVHVKNVKGKANPSPIALEPCHTGKAAVLTLLIRLPTGGHCSIPPPGQTGIALASSLVTLGNVSLGETTKEDKEKNNCDTKNVLNTNKLTNIGNFLPTGV